MLFDTARPESKVKSVAQLGVYLPWVDVMRAAESVAGIEQISGIGDVDRVSRNRPAFAEVFTDR